MPVILAHIIIHFLLMILTFQVRATFISPGTRRYYLEEDKEEEEEEEEEKKNFEKAKQD